MKELKSESFSLADDSTSGSLMPQLMMRQSRGPLSTDLVGKGMADDIYHK